MPALVAAALLTGCASHPPLTSDAAAVELESVPFFPQERYQCGPAALATLLDASGVPVDLDALVAQVYLPARQGSLQAELKAGARRAGRLPLEITPTPDALAAELAAGRPVLVLQNLGVGWLPRWHYAVVVGLDPADRTVILRSGTERRRVTPLRVFLNTWARSGYWGIVALRPGELPVGIDRERIFDALAAAEEAGQHGLAAAGWRAALERWTDADVALFGLGNSLHALEDFTGAERAFLRLLERRPRLAAVRNNLAVTLLELGRLADAEAQARIALEDTDDEALAAAIRATLEEIDAARLRNGPASPENSPIARVLACPLSAQGMFLTRKYTRYSARSENPLCGQMAARDSRESVRFPG